MARKQVTKKQQFWPGTNIVKSSGNAFDWRNKEQRIFTKAEIAQMQQKQNVNHPITVYSRA
jgi:hypothetical protein